VVKYLLGSKFSFNVLEKNNKGKSPLKLATFHGTFEVLDLLLRKINAGGRYEDRGCSSDDDDE
jgi:hypothetical protein